MRGVPVVPVLAQVGRIPKFRLIRVDCLAMETPIPWASKRGGGDRATAPTRCAAGLVWGPLRWRPRGVRGL